MPEHDDDGDEVGLEVEGLGRLTADDVFTYPNAKGNPTRYIIIAEFTNGERYFLAVATQADYLATPQEEDHNLYIDFLERVDYTGHEEKDLRRIVGEAENERVATLFRMREAEYKVRQETGLTVMPSIDEEN